MEISYAGIFIYPLVDIGGLERIKRLVRWNSLPKQHDCVQHSPAIKRLATKSLVATTGSLITSLVNIGILENGAQLHSVCLSSCSLDVLINVGIIYFVSQRSWLQKLKFSDSSLTDSFGDTDYLSKAMRRRYDLSRRNSGQHNFARQFRQRRWIAMYSDFDQALRCVDLCIECCKIKQSSPE